MEHLERTEPTYFSTSGETSSRCCLSHQRRYTTPSVCKTRRTSYRAVVVQLPEGVVSFIVFLFGFLAGFSAVGWSGVSGAWHLGWSCVVVELLCVGLFLFWLCFFSFSV
jgi:hypothetical protein